MKGNAIRRRRGALLVLCVFLLSMVASILGGCQTTKDTAENTEPPVLPDRMSLGMGKNPVTVLTNDRFQLAIDPTNMGVVLTDTVRQTEWRSNPEGELAARNAQFSLSYVDGQGNYSQMESYSDCVERFQASVHKPEDGSCVYVQYMLGNYELTAEILPQTINAKKFQARILDKLDGADKEEMQEYYKYYESEDVWSLRTKGFARFERVYELLQQVGYTDEDIQDDNVEFGLSSAALNRPYFTIVLKYTLTEEGFAVEVPTEHIRRAEDYYPYKLTLFELFGTAGQQEEGYLFVPDGSGALIRFRDVAGDKEKLSLPVYGNDLTVTATAVLDAKVQTERVTLPVFGMKKGTEGFLALIEDGAATTSIEAYRAGSYNKYNAVYPVFTLIEKDNIYLEGSEQSTRVPRFQKELYDGAFRVQYMFLDRGDNGYNEMAATLREHYVATGVLKKLADPTVPFYLETVGAVTGYKSLLGVSYTGVLAATRYTDNIAMLEALAEVGVDNVRLILNGWFNGGVYHGYPRNIRLMSQLGGKKDFNALLEYAEAEGVLLYPQVNLMTVDRKGNGFWSLQHSARTLDLLEAKVAVRSYATGQKLQDDGLMHTASYILRPSVATSLTKTFLKAYEKYGQTSLFLSTSGNELYSDFLQSDNIDRNSSVAHSVEGLAAVAGQMDQVMVNEGNSYALPYATDILNIASESTGYQLTDEDVPFLQMVLHSYVNMAGDPINLAEDNKTAPLRALEYGMSLHYQLTYEPSYILKDTNFSQNYASHYEGWLEQIEEQYVGMSALLEQVHTADMVRHERLAEDVYRVTYSNGCAVVVNYSEEAYTVDGLTVEPMHYGLSKEGV